MLAGLGDPRATEDGYGGKQKHQANKIQDQVHPGPVVNAAFLLARVDALDRVSKMAIGRGDEGCHEKCEFARKSQGPDGKVDNVRALPPVE